MVINMPYAYFILLAFSLTFVFLDSLIKYEKKLNKGQIEREEGLRSHKSKNHTPTLGGLVFVLVIIFVYTLYIFCFEKNTKNYLLIMIALLGYFLIGLIDDLLIVIKGNNNGLSSDFKFLLQIVVASIFFYYYIKYNNDTSIDIFHYKIDLKFMYGIFILLLFSGFTNATNLTDGIDGLLAGTMIIAFFIVSNLVTYKDLKTLIIISISALLAYLYYNLPKAQIFMGDSGSLALGSIFISIAIIEKKEVIFLLVGLLYIVEAVSVILQVLYFKVTKGKRLFKMAPIHHHFEVVFGSEEKTLGLFYLLALIFGLLALLIRGIF